jgi:hypothetical protein
LPDAEAEALAGHPLEAAEGAQTPGGQISIHYGPRIIGGRYFRVHLGDTGGDRRFLSGLHNRGPYPGQHWIEVIDIDLPPGLDPGGDWEEGLAGYMGPLVEAAIPPGGHLMVEYESDKWHSTQVGLLAGIPPLATPMGLLFHRLGCASSFKDWYFPEGGMEGARKLHGNRPLGEAHARETGRQRLVELEAYLSSAPRGDAAIEGRARATAARVATELRASVTG